MGVRYLPSLYQELLKKPVTNEFKPIDNADGCGYIIGCLIGGPAFSIGGPQQVGYWNCPWLQGKQYGGGMRFRNVTVPPGSNILKAYLKIVAYSNYSVNYVRSKLRVEDSANPGAFVDEADLLARTWAAFVYWDEIEAFTRAVTYNSPDITSLIQYIVNLPGWASGNSIVITWDDWDDRSDANIHCYRRGRDVNILTPDLMPILHIDWEELS